VVLVQQHVEHVLVLDIAQALQGLTVAQVRSERDHVWVTFCKTRDSRRRGGIGFVEGFVDRIY